MNRRLFLAATAAAPVIGRLGSAEAAETSPTLAWRQFEVTTRITLQNSPGPAQLWLPLAQTAGGYQVAIDVRWQGNGRSELVRDDAYGTTILRSTWDHDCAPSTIGSWTPHGATRKPPAAVSAM